MPRALPSTVRLLPLLTGIVRLALPRRSGYCYEV
jgi:hypothetical protein